MADYRIEFSLQRRREGDADYAEIGFGSSGTWASPRDACHIVASAIGTWEWETTAGMPDPLTVKAELEAAADA